VNQFNKQKKTATQKTPASGVTPSKVVKSTMQTRNVDLSLSKTHVLGPAQKYDTRLSKGKPSITKTPDQMIVSKRKSTFYTKKISQTRTPKKALVFSNT